MRYWAVRYLLSTLTAVVVFATPAHAQSTPAGPYVFGGWSLQVREGTALNGVTFGGGVPLTATVSAEGSIGWYAARVRDFSNSLPFFGASQRQNTDRDVPLAGAIRWSPRCAGRVCVDVVGGAGVNFHLVTSRTLFTCPPPGTFGPCVEIDRVDETNHTEFLLTTGVDVKVRLNRHLAVVPGVRFSLPFRIGVPLIFPPLGAAEGVPYYLVNVTAFYRF